MLPRFCPIYLPAVACVETGRKNSNICFRSDCGLEFGLHLRPFGKHKSRTVGELAGSASGRDDLRWMAANIEGNAAKAAGIVLAEWRSS